MLLHRVLCLIRADAIVGRGKAVVVGREAAAVAPAEAAAAAGLLSARPLLLLLLLALLLLLLPGMVLPAEQKEHYLSGPDMCLTAAPAASPPASTSSRSVLSSLSLTARPPAQQ